MAEKVTELERTEFYAFTWDSDSAILRFAWTPKTAEMSDQDFKEALSRYADFANQPTLNRRAWPRCSTR